MNATLSVDAATLTRLSPLIKSELRRLAEELAREGAPSVATALRQVFTGLFGVGRSPGDEMYFLMNVAPLARKIAIRVANADARVDESDVRISDVREWLGWLDMFDPVCARMIDLHYFAGLSARQTAAALKLPPRMVVRDLKFAKSWLQTRL